MLYHSILRRPAQDAPAGSGEGAEFNIKMDKRFEGDLVRVSIFCKMG